MNIANLLSKGRLDPIHKTDGAGEVWLVGYRRRSGSRKAGQEYFLKKPRKVAPEK